MIAKNDSMHSAIEQDIQNRPSYLFSQMDVFNAHPYNNQSSMPIHSDKPLSFHNTCSQDQLIQAKESLTSPSNTLKAMTTTMSIHPDHFSTHKTDITSADMRNLHAIDQLTHKNKTQLSNAKNERQIITTQKQSFRRH